MMTMTLYRDCFWNPVAVHLSCGLTAYNPWEALWSTELPFHAMGVADQPSPLKYLTNFAREAEQMGCAYGVTGDRLEAGIDPFSVLTAVTEASGRMRLVTSVLVLPPRGILVAAKLFASLDVLSGGRVIAGVGTGSMFRDYEVVGMDHRDMWPRFEEGVQAMRAYLTPGAPPFQGRFYDTNGVNLRTDTRAKAQPADLDR